MDIEDLLDTRNAAQLLGVKPTTIHQWRYRRICPLRAYVFRVGQRTFLRWSREEIEALLLREGADELPTGDATGSARKQSEGAA